MAVLHNIQHKRRASYSQCVDGTVERLNRNTLTDLRSLLIELKLSPRDSVSVIDVVSAIINKAPTERFGRNDDETTQTPLQNVTSMKTRRALVQLMGNDVEPVASCKIKRDIAEHVSGIKSLSDTLHKEVIKRGWSRRQKAIDAHNNRTNIVSPQFLVGYYSDVFCKATKSAHRLAFV